ncbi:unnamed protein product [Peronospora belbahrii]|uniref:Micro-fibrillar-associated protein 1 C-terminal domain-containing protein n=1 Tax=Peronospora belbahrii TaxID=622444 RepID=A0AAU9KSF7_9STRA|nr:unnamed protein product [Peronospora belbahrii]CAH0517936.1 unnamed protein product [Peronospora belbahrii]
MSLFSKKDLGLLLPDDTPGDPISLRHTNTKEKTDVFKPLKPRVDPSKKVVRYRAGQVPKFAHGYEDDRGFVTANSQVRVLSKAKAKHKTGQVISTGRKRVEALVVSSSALVAEKVSRNEEDDAKMSRDNEESSGEDVAKALLDSSSDEEDDSDIDRRRRMLRSKVMAREAQREEKDKHAEPEKGRERQPVVPQIVKQSTVTDLLPTASNGNLETSSSSSSEYETDTDDSEPGEELMKPVFVPKKSRGTLKRQEEIAAEEERREKREQEKMKTRKMESRRLVAEDVQREQNSTNKGDDDTDVEMPDDTDGLDPAQEYREWELREMRRIKRDRDRKEQRIKEEEEARRRRNMTQEERTAEDAKLKKNEPKQKKKLKFMQKYYHKGVFYVDDDSIRSKDDVRKRDATEATLEDKFNKEMLPTVMQVKNFGRAGRTKYTHLADQDTSSRDSLWARNDDIREKYKSQLGGMKDIDGSTKRRRKE